MGQQPCVCVTVLVLLTQEFTGNSDRDTVVENVLNLPIEAKFIRFQPTAWHGHISRATNFSIYTTKMEGAGPKSLGTGAKLKQVPCQKNCRVNRAEVILATK